MQAKLPRIFYNKISLFGVAIAGVGLFIFLFLFAILLVRGEGASYAGLVIFILVPSILVFGIILVVAGAVVQWVSKKRHKGDISDLLIINLGNPRHRNNTIIFAVLIIIFFFLSAFGSYQAYHYTDSVAFCGQLCHPPMKPEFVAYQNSPHARVKCVECHVGHGANWYVKSKMSGLYQVYATVFEKYPTPIPTPIKNLRPARETCEQCHWPEQFYGAQQKYTSHYLPDEQNTPWDINLLIKTGGGSSKFGHSSGIHWHMNTLFEIEYISTDDKRQNIPWIRAKDMVTGEVTVYMSTEEPLEHAFDTYELRTMDCMDCHNRPTHIFLSPNEIVNLAIAVGQVDQSLPYIKKVAVEAMSNEYATVPEAMDGIATTISVFYRAEYPDVLVDQEEALRESITQLQEAYSRNFFPEMKVSWRNYPDNLGHLNFPGCFRCHDEKHESSDGRMISRECNSCHLILAQGPDEGEGKLDASGMDFIHPVDIGEAWREMPCSDCHEGVLP